MDFRVGFAPYPNRASVPEKIVGTTLPPRRASTPVKNNVRFGHDGNTTYPLHEMLRRERPPYTSTLGRFASYLDMGTWFNTYRPDVKTLERILDREKMDVNLLDQHGDTPLHVLMKRKDVSPDEINLLLSRGADVNLPDKDMDTVLHVLLKKPDANPSQLRQLLSQGANVHLKNKIWETPIFSLLAQQDPNLENIKILMKAGAKLDQPGGKAHPPILRFLTNNPKPDPKTLQYLLENGVKLNERYGFNLRTPLHWAVEHREPSVEAVKLLLEHGANPHLKDGLGKTPLQHYQQQFADHQLPEAVQVLQRHMEKVRQHTPTLRIEELDALEKVPDQVRFVRVPEPSVASGVSEIVPVSAAKISTSPAVRTANPEKNIRPLLIAWQKLMKRLQIFWEMLTRFLLRR